jgi:hypothetical protein
LSEFINGNFVVIKLRRNEKEKYGKRTGTIPSISVNYITFYSINCQKSFLQYHISNHESCGEGNEVSDIGEKIKWNKTEGRG